MFSRLNLIFLTLQIVVWTLLIGIPYYNSPPNIEHYYWNFHVDLLSKYTIYILAFNLNYFYFVPFLFQKRKFLLYASLIILTFVFSVIVNTLVQENLFPKGEIKEFRFHLLTVPSMIIIYGVSTAFRALFDWLGMKEQTEVLQQEKQKAELAFLRSQINPHFLFNTLNNIAELIHKDANVAEEYVLKLSTILRTILSNGDKDQISLSKEIELINNYIHLQKIRLSKNNKLNYIVNGNGGEKLIEPFILINFIENVFKHGLSDKENEMIISISITNSSLTLVTENNITNGNTDSETGIGLKNVKKRLDIIYKSAYSLITDRSEDHYKVKLEIPLND